MDWREIIIKDMQGTRGRKKTQTRMAGGNRPSQAKEQYLEHYSNRDDSSLDDEEQIELDRTNLASATREDLMDKVMDLIGSYSEEQLIELLIGTQGNIEVGAIQVRDNR